jgi:hypothetical protein
MVASTQWLFNFIISKITPSAIHNLGWRTFLMYAIFCLANAAFAFFFVKETKGRTLEEMNTIFATVELGGHSEKSERVMEEGKDGIETNVSIRHVE